MAAVRVVTDSSCDLPADVVAEHGIEVVPLTIRFGTEEFVDRVDLSPDQFWAKCASSSALPETAAPAPGAFEAAFRRAAAAGADGVVCINLASKLSATSQSAEAAAQAVEGDLAVRVVDSTSVTLGLGMIVVAAARLAAGGAGLDEVAAAAEDLAGRTRVHGALDTLEYLQRGGRIGKAQALLGSILSVKPIIEVRDGAVEPGPKLRTRSKALAYLAERVAAEPALENLAVLHGDAPDVDAFLAMLDPHFPRQRIVVGDLGAVVGTHAGPRTIGVAFQVPGVVPDTSRTIHAGRRLVNRYVLRRLIDKGGMAEVWEATDSVLDRAVAVKVLYPHLAVDASFTERFRLEAIAAARLAHPNVVATYDTGVDDGLAFIVMELVDGHTLRDELARGPVGASTARDIAAQVANALDYAHRAGIVHRDIKPANILLCPDGRAKVADFGIAKAALDDGEPAKDLTGTGAIIGTAKYLSPEQVDGRALDGRSDVYALGVVLYETLCGRPPFTGGTDMVLGIQHLSSRPADPRSVRADVPRALEAIVLKALEKSPADRFPSAASMQEALERADLGGVAPGGDETALHRSANAFGHAAANAFGHAAATQATPRPHPLVDDAEPLVVRDDTPPGGPSAIVVRRERRWLPPALIATLVAVTLGVVAVVLAQSDLGGADGPGAGDGAAGGGGAVTVQAALAFDPPPGSGAEHDDELAFLVDGDPATTWSTETYSSPQFGGLKEGVGFVLQLDGSRRLDRLAVTSSSRGWSAEVAVAESPRTTREDWGQPVDAKSNVGGGTVTFDLAGRNGGAVLVWITDLGDGAAVEVSEARVT